MNAAAKAAIRKTAHETASLSKQFQRPQIVQVHNSKWPPPGIDDDQRSNFSFFHHSQRGARQFTGRYGLRIPGHAFANG
jgi:hypothetical protein